MPIRIVHGAEDPVIPVEESRRMAEALRRAGARDAHYFELAGVGHDAWGPAYGDDEGWRWLFAQRR
jgi:pimeloyl-ACP methyl ester carboxylesterase